MAFSAHGGSRVAGAVLWLLITQFFVAQAVIAAAWRTPFSLARNAVSDLGALHCHQDTLVCSPLHAAMNTSFLLLGACVGGGGLLVVAGIAGRIGPAGWLLALSGVGGLLVGGFPEDVGNDPHVIGATVAIGCGNAGVIGLGRLLRHDFPVAARLSVVLGVLGTVGELVGVLMLGGVVGGLNDWGGAVERVAIYPMLVAMVATAVALLAHTVALRTGRTPPRRATARR